MLLNRINSAAAILLLLMGTAWADDAAGLPDGASTINESHGDWTVRCATAAAGQPNPGVHCGISQTLMDKKTNKRVLLIGLSQQVGGAVKGTLLMPFGLALKAGATLQIDDGPVTSPASFRTCLPAGCLINLDWPQTTVVALRNAKVLKVHASGDNGQAADFTVSLNGFGSAIDRVSALVPAK